MLVHILVHVEALDGEIGFLPPGDTGRQDCSCSYRGKEGSDAGDKQVAFNIAKLHFCVEIVLRIIVTNACPPFSESPCTITFKVHAVGVYNF
jgi:hypothetical protein